MAATHKLLIAEGTDELRQALLDILIYEFQTEVCSDGLQAQNLLRTFQPDIVILDLMLTQIDGITLLRQLANSDSRPIVVAVARFISDYMLNVLQGLQVDYLVYKPYQVVCVADRVRELAQLKLPGFSTAPEPANPLGRFLVQMGFSPKVDGFAYLNVAIPLYMEDPDQNITKELYAAVGRKFHKSSEQVERSIRSAIQTAWERRDNRLWRSFLSCGPDGQVPRPSNGELISSLAMHFSGFLDRRKIL